MVLLITFYYMLSKLALKIMEILKISFAVEELKIFLIIHSIILFIPINWIIIQIMMITKILSSEISMIIILISIITVYWVTIKVCEI